MITSPKYRSIANKLGQTRLGGATGSRRRLKLESLESRMVLSANFALDFGPGSIASPFAADSAAIDFRFWGIELNSAPVATEVRTAVTIDIGENSARPMLFSEPAGNGLPSAVTLNSSELTTYNVGSGTSLNTSSNQLFPPAATRVTSVDGTLTNDLSGQIDFGLAQSGSSQFIAGAVGEATYANSTPFSSSVSDPAALAFGNLDSGLSSSLTLPPDLSGRSGSTGSLDSGFETDGLSVHLDTPFGSVDDSVFRASSFGPEFGVEPVKLIPQAALSNSIVSGGGEPVRSTVAADSSSGSNGSSTNGQQQTASQSPTNTGSQTIDFAVNHVESEAPQGKTHATVAHVFAANEAPAQSSAHELAMARQQRFVMASDRLKSRSGQSAANDAESNATTGLSPFGTQNRSVASSRHRAANTDVAVASYGSNIQQAFDHHTRSGNESASSFRFDWGVSDRTDAKAGSASETFEWSLEMLMAGSFFGAFVVWQRGPVFSNRTETIARLNK